MAVNVFGSSGENSNMNKNYVDSKFIILTRDLDTKLEKSGGTLTGNLNMGNKHITDLANPNSDEDACNKKFLKQEIKAESLLVKLYVDTLLHTKLDKNIAENLNMNGQQVMGLENPKRDDEVSNKKYVDESISNIENSIDFLNARSITNTQKDDITAENLFDIGTIIKNLLKTKDINEEHFLKSFNYVEKMYEKYNEIFESKSGNVSDILKTCVLYSNLKV